MINLIETYRIENLNDSLWTGIKQLEFRWRIDVELAIPCFRLIVGIKAGKITT